MISNRLVCNRLVCTTSVFEIVGELCNYARNCRCRLLRLCSAWWVRAESGELESTLAMLSGVATPGPARATCVQCPGN